MEHLIEPKRADVPAVHAAAASAPSAPSASRPGARPVPVGGGGDHSAHTTPAGIPWGIFAAHRADVRRRWPLLWELPVVADDFGPVAGLAPAVRPASILDVGATDRRHRERLLALGAAPATYASLDVDRTLPHDYHDFEDLDRTFDLVSCVEVLEHVEAATAATILRACAAACRPGGHVYLTVPNHVVPYAQLEFTHRTAFTHLDLGALCRLAGLEPVAMVRIARGTRRGRWIHRRLLGRWHRLMRTDFCPSIGCLARRTDASVEVMP